MQLSNHYPLSPIIPCFLFLNPPGCPSYQFTTGITRLGQDIMGHLHIELNYNFCSTPGHRENNFITEGRWACEAWFALEKKFTLALPNHHHFTSTSRELPPFFQSLKYGWPSFKMDALSAFLQLSGTKVKVVLLKVKCLSTQAVHLTRFWSTGFAWSFSLGWSAL